MYGKSEGTFVRSLRFESDSSDNERQVVKKIPSVKRTSKKRKYVEESDDVHNQLVTQSGNDDGSGLLIQTVCSELNAVINEKKRYFDKFATGAKKAFKSEVKNLQTFCSNQQGKCNKVNDNVRSLHAENISLIESTRPKEQALLSAMHQMLEAAKEKRAKLQENLETFQKIHEAYMKEMMNYEEGYVECSNETKSNLAGELKNIQREMIEEIQRKAMKQNLKEMCSSYTEDAPTSKNPNKTLVCKDLNEIKSIGEEID